MELSQISSGLYRSRIKRLSNSDLQSAHCIKSVHRSQSGSIIKLSRISSAAYKPRVTHVNKNDLPMADHSQISKPEGTPIKRLYPMTSFYYRHRITPFSHEDFQSIYNASSINSFKTVQVSLSTETVSFYQLMFSILVQQEFVIS
jgi:hypothetical protein